MLAARGGLWFAVGVDRQLHIRVELHFAAARRAHPALTLDSVAALDALAGKLARVGHESCWDADLPGARRFYVGDPFGNRWELPARGPGIAAPRTGA